MKKIYFYWLGAATASLLLAEDPEVMHKLSESHETQASETNASKSFLTPNFTYFDVSVNYLDWSSGTERRSAFYNGSAGLTDFVYLELEGGAGWDWGELYFFTDLENPTKSWNNPPTDERRFVIKPILDVQLGESNWYFHLQDYYLYSKTFFVNNLVPGIAYKFSTGNGFWIRPFIGPHYQQSTFYDGFNGWMAGWTFVYDFKLDGEKFSLSNWHEFEFDRAEAHYALPDGTLVGDGRSWGINGALALWWHPNPKITAGLQYRYADHKLGVQAYTTAVIYSLKYNF